MKKILLSILVIIFLLLGACANIDSGGEVENKVPTSEGSISLEPIEITGVDSETSAPFMVSTDEWVIDWSFIPDSNYPDMAVFSLFIYPRGVTDRYVAAVYFAEEDGTTYCYAYPGEYYAKVAAANIDRWEITITPVK